MIRVPFESLSADVLDALVEEFVTRQGTDLAEAEAKIAQVRAKLKSGDVIITWDEKTESANIVPKDAKEEPVKEEAARDDAPAFREPSHLRDEPKSSEEGDGRRIVYDEPAPPDPTDY